MATFLDDTFTEASDRALSNAFVQHTADTGGTWARHGNDEQGGFATWAIVYATNDELYGLPATGQNAIFYSPATPADNAQQTVWELVRRGAYNTGQGIRFFHRGSTTWGDGIVAILVNDQASSVRVFLYKYVSGVLSAFDTGGSPASFAMTQNAVTYLKMISVGTTTYLGYSTDGTNYTTLLYLTDASAPTQVGKIGLAYTDYTASSTGGINITRVTGIDGASLPSGPQTISVGTASETDTAPAISATLGAAPQTVSVGTASETDSAVAVAAVFNQTISVGTASETDSPGDVNVESVSGTRAQGGMALLFRSRTAPASQTITVGTATETDTAFSVTIPANQTITVGTATETDSPGAVSVASPQTISVGTATETDTAAAVTIVLPGTIVVHPQGMVPGTSIGAYLRWEWKGPVAAKLNAGPGAAVETTTVADDLTATFTLPAGEYVAYADAYPTKRLFFMVTE